MGQQLKTQADVDRRAHPRSPIVVREARCISGIDVFFGYARNIGRGGVFIATPKKRDVGEIHEIQFVLPGLERTFRCRARVVWLRSYRHDSLDSPGFGLEFIDLPQEDGLAIEAWVQSAGPL
jgi:uncharacterized protein (TIGR02266 family)